MKKTYIEGCLAGHTYDYGNLPAKRIHDLEKDMVTFALEGLDNPKINQYLIDQEKRGLNTYEAMVEIIMAYRANPEKFMKEFRIEFD